MWFKALEYIKKIFGLRSAFHESMTSFMLWFPIFLISPPKAFQNIDVIFLKKRRSFIKYLFHAGMFRVEVLPTVRILDFFLSMTPFVFFLLRARRLFMLLFLNFRLRSFKFGFWVLLLISFTLEIFGPWDIEGLITGGSDDPHLDKIIMFTF